MQIRGIPYSVFPVSETPRPIFLGCKKMSIFGETKKEKIYECKLVIKSNAYQVQQKFKSIKKALKKIDFVYLDEPTYRKSPSYSKSSNTTDFGEFKVTFIAPDGVIKRIDQREPTIEHVIVLNSIIGMKITPKKDIWNKGMHEYEDTFTVMRQCTTDPIN